MEQPIMHTENLSIGYTSNRNSAILCDDINLTLNAGKLIALIGANGIGKSTLLRTLTGIQPPLAGSVMLNGKEIRQLSAIALAQQLSLVLTEKLPPSNLSVFELVALGRQPYTNWIGTLTAEDREKVKQALELTQISTMAQRKHFEISDGQLQKVLVARALAQDTPLIVLDEPTTHLDLLHKVSLFKLLRKLTREAGKTILFSTHDIDLALEVSDELAVMHSGKLFQDTPQMLIQEGRIDALFGNQDVIFDHERRKFVFKNL